MPEKASGTLVSMSDRPFLRRGPSGPRADESPPSVLVQLGYDTAATDVTLDNSSIFVPRNALGAPLEVTFPSFTVGNALEIDFRLSGRNGSGANTRVVATPQLSLDGGANFYPVVPANAGSSAGTPADSLDRFALTSLSSILIVDPMTVLLNGTPTLVPITGKLVVRVSYFTDEDVTVGGIADPNGNGQMVLKCSELLASAVFQGPLHILARNIE